VECDIPGCIFEKEISLDYDKPKEYKVIVNPKIGGQFMNAITFTDK
jgi:hypothetical protein